MKPLPPPDTYKPPKLYQVVERLIDFSPGIYVRPPPGSVGTKVTAIKVSPMPGKMVAYGRVRGKVMGEERELFEVALSYLYQIQNNDGFFHFAHKPIIRGNEAFVIEFGFEAVSGREASGLRCWLRLEDHYEIP